MTYSTGTLAANARATLKPLLEAAGFTYVGTPADYSRTPYQASARTTTADVFKSPAGSNVSDTDWYLIVAEWTTFVNLEVCEGFTLGTELMTRYVPSMSLAAPAIDVDFSTGATGVTLDNSYATEFAQASPVANTGAFVMNATPDRVILRVGNNSVYAGLGAPLHPEAIDPRMPLVQALLSGTTTAVPVGGFTREPTQTIAADGNFHGRFDTATPTNNRLYGHQLATVVDGYSGRILTSPVVLKSERLTTTSRCVLRDLRTTGRAQVLGDTLIEVDEFGVSRDYVLAGVTCGIFLPVA